MLVIPDRINHLGICVCVCLQQNTTYCTACEQQQILTVALFRKGQAILRDTVLITPEIIQLWFDEHQQEQQHVPTSDKLLKT